MSDDALDLAFRSGLPFVGLRDHQHDPDLDSVVPRDAARSARAVPLAAADDHVRLAVADPDTDLAALAPYLAGRRVELAIAPREEVEAVLGPADVAPAAAAREATPDVFASRDEAPREVAPDQAAPRDEAPKEAAPEQPLGEAAGSEPPAPAAARESPSAEPEPLAAEPQPAAPDDATEPLAAAAEPQAAAEAEPDEAAPASAQAADESPSWLEPPRKRSRLRVVGIVLLVLLVLAVVGGAVAAYLLTR